MVVEKMGHTSTPHKIRRTGHSRIRTRLLLVSVAVEKMEPNADDVPRTWHPRTLMRSMLVWIFPSCVFMTCAICHRSDQSHMPGLDEMWIPSAQIDRCRGFLDGKTFWCCQREDLAFSQLVIVVV
jgi:hypothetical protein